MFKGEPFQREYQNQSAPALLGCRYFQIRKLSYRNTRLRLEEAKSQLDQGSHHGQVKLMMSPII